MPSTMSTFQAYSSEAMEKEVTDARARSSMLEVQLPNLAVFARVGLAMTRCHLCQDSDLTCEHHWASICLKIYLPCSACRDSPTLSTFFAQPVDSAQFGSLHIRDYDDSVYLPVEDFLHLKALLPTSCLEQKMLHGVYPYYSGLEGHGLGGLKLKTQRNTHAATQWFNFYRII